MRKPSLKHYRQRRQIERDLCLISIVHRSKLVSRGRIRRESGADSHQRPLQQILDAIARLCAVALLAHGIFVLAPNSK